METERSTTFKKFKGSSRIALKYVIQTWTIVTQNDSI